MQAATKRSKQKPDRNRERDRVNIRFGLAIISASFAKSGQIGQHLSAGKDGSRTRALSNPCSRLAIGKLLKHCLNDICLLARGLLFTLR